MAVPPSGRMDGLFASVALELAPDGIAWTDEFGRILHANRRFEQLFGFTREQLAGHAVEMLLPERARAAHVVDRHHFEELPAARPMGNGGELWARHADGTEFPVEVALSPVTTGYGIRTIMTVREVSERRATEDAVRAQAVQADHERMADALNEGVIRPIFSASLRLHGILESSGEHQITALLAAISELDDAIHEVRQIVFLRDAGDRPLPPTRSHDQAESAGSDRTASDR